MVVKNIKEGTSAKSLYYKFSIAGEMINEKDRCKDCKGKKTMQTNKILEVHVDKGMRDSQKIPFRGEGDQQVRDERFYAV